MKTGYTTWFLFRLWPALTSYVMISSPVSIRFLMITLMEGFFKRYLTIGNSTIFPSFGWSLPSFLCNRKFYHHLSQAWEDLFYNAQIICQRSILILHPTCDENRFALAKPRIEVVWSPLRLCPPINAQKRRQINTKPSNNSSLNLLLWPKK